MSYRLQISHGSSDGPAGQNWHPYKEKSAWDPWTMKLAINHHFFELETQDFTMQNFHGKHATKNFHAWNP